MKIFIPYTYIGTDELKYTLRSAEKYMPHSGVVICGSQVPDWVQNVEFVEYEQIPGGINKGNNTHGKMMHCLDILGDNFIAYNDDYFLMQAWEFENYYSRKLSEFKNKNDWGKVVANTILLIGDVTSFDVHCPIVFNSEKLRALDLPNIDYGWLVKTIYAHTYKLKGTFHPDTKLRKPTDPNTIRERINGKKFFTTHEVFWNETMIEIMDELYPEKSKYER